MIHFNNYFEFLKNEAKNQGLRKGAWMEKSGMCRSRYCEFERTLLVDKKRKTKEDKEAIAAFPKGFKRRNISPEYFLRLIRGLNMTDKKVQRMSGIRFTEEQKKEIGFSTWIEANKDWFKKLYMEPEVYNACKTIADSIRK